MVDERVAQLERRLPHVQGNGAADDDEHRDGTRPHEEHRQDGGGDRRQLGGLGFGEEVPERGDRPVDDGADDVE